MEKSIFFTFAILLPLMMGYVSITMSSTTVTQCCQYVQMLCSFFTGVDIGSEIPWLPQNIAFQEIVLNYLESEVSDPNFDRGNLYTRNEYRYFPGLTVVVDDQKRFFISEPRHSITDATHAEAKLIQFLNDTGQLSTIAYLNITNSPCKECARKIIEAFKDRYVKPDINILWVYGKGSKPDKDAKYMNAIMSLRELQLAGFKVGVWDWKDYGEYLKSIAHADYARADLEYSMIVYAKAFEKRTKITKYSLDTINSFDALDEWEYIWRVMNEDEENEDDNDGGDDGDGDEPDHEDNDAVPDDEEDRERNTLGGLIYNFFRNAVIYLSVAVNEYTGWENLVIMPRWYYIATTGVSAVLGWLVAYSGLRLTSA